jgi:hypothetical protein
LPSQIEGGYKPTFFGKSSLKLGRKEEERIRGEKNNVDAIKIIEKSEQIRKSL